MNKKIFRSTLLASLLVLLASLFLIMGILFEYLESNVTRRLKDETDYISVGIEQEGLSYLDNLKAEDERITIIDKSGKVLADTVADPEKMENHADREEVKEALKKGEGTSVRYSKTLTEKIIYVAVKMKDGNILRLCTSRDSVITILLGIAQPVAIVIIFAIILSFVLSRRVSKSIVKPINSLDLDNPENNDAYDELSPLLTKIASQKRIINSQLKEARQKQEEFSLITENMSEGFVVIDKDKKILSYNTAAADLLGIEEAPFGTGILEINRTRGFRKVIEKALGGKRAREDIEENDRVYSLISSPVYDDDEKIVGAAIIIIDVTERVRNERIRREFTSNVSHELKTPLTSISGFAEIMKEGGTDEETVKDFSKSIYDEAKRLINLVSDIIKIGELDENSEILDKENIDLLGLSQEIAGRLKPEAEKKKVTISVKGEKAEVYGTRRILDELVYNLCDNAIKYNKENGSVEVYVRKENNRTVITVTDTGIGIAPEHRDRIFERFYRVDKSHSKAVGGTGLGLSIVKHAAISQGGEISLESKLGQGTAITVSFKPQKNSSK